MTTASNHEGVMNHHITAALAQAKVDDLRRETHRRQRARVLASLVAVPVPAKPSHRRWAEPFSAPNR